jgi:hypothetical protein
MASRALDSGRLRLSQSAGQEEVEGQGAGR